MFGCTTPIQISIPPNNVRDIQSVYQNSPPLAQVDRGAVGRGAGEREGERVGGGEEVDGGRGRGNVVHVPEVLVDGAGGAVDEPFSILGVDMIFTR